MPWIYSWKRIRRFIGGKWGRASGAFWGGNWHRLSAESLEWHEDWDLPSNGFRWRYYAFKVDDNGMLLRRVLGDPSETWYAIARVD